MPRKGAKGKWDLKMSPDEWYWKVDPHEIKDSLEEQNKRDIIGSMIDMGRVLDIGCGEGHLINHVYNENYYYGIDVSLLAIARAKRMYGSGFFWVQDISNERLDNKYKYIILSEVLYYIKPDRWYIVSENIKAALENNGMFIVSVGQYFTENDIMNIFPWCKFDKVFKLPSNKYEYNLIMSGRKK